MSAIVSLIAHTFRAVAYASCNYFPGYSHDAMRSLMWHEDQKSVCSLVLAIVNEAQTT